MTELSTMGTIFAVIILAFSLVCLGFFIALAIYFDRARNYANANPSAPISAGTASLMMWFSIIMTLFATGLLIYGIVYLVRQSSAAKKLKEAQMTTTTIPTTNPVAQAAINDSNLKGQDCSLLSNDALRQSCIKVNPEQQSRPLASAQAQYGAQTPDRAQTQYKSTLTKGDLGQIPRSSYYGY